MVKSYFINVAGFYRSRQRRCSVKKVSFERCSQNSQENTCVRDSILTKLQAEDCKKETLAHVFSVHLAKFLRKLFLQDTSRQLLLLLTFQKQPPKVFYKKGVLENLSKFKERHLWFAKFLRTSFLQNTPTTATLL